MGVVDRATPGRDGLGRRPLGERVAALLPDEATLDAWAARREQALALPPAEREHDLAGLRADIRAALGLPEVGLAGGAA